MSRMSSAFIICYVLGFVSCQSLSETSEDTSMTDLIKATKVKITNLRNMIPSANPPFNQKVVEINTEARTFFNKKMEILQSQYNSRIREITAYGNAQSINIINNECSNFDRNQIMNTKMIYENQLHSYLNKVNKLTITEAELAFNHFTEVWNDVADIYIDFKNCKNVSCLEGVNKNIREIQSRLAENSKEYFNKINMITHKENTMEFAFDCFAEVYKEIKDTLNKTKYCVDAIRIYNEKIENYKKSLKLKLFSEFDPKKLNETQFLANV